MANAGHVFISVKANTRPFKKSMGGVSKRLRSFKKGLSVAGKALGIFGGIATAVAGGGLLLLTKSSAAAIDTTAKWADRLGIATDKLIGMQHAAKMAGVDSKTMSLGLQRMTRRLAEAAQNSGEAQGAIKELGLEAVALNQLSPDEQFRRLADAMLGVENQSDRVRLSMKLFDSEGVALVNLMKQGAAGLDKYQAEAERLGITFSRIDAAKIELANDAMTRMRAAFTGVGNALAIKLAPAFEAVAGTVAKIVSQWVDWGGAIDRVANALLTFIGLSLDGFGLIKKGFKYLQISALDFFRVVVRELHKLFFQWHKLPDWMGGGNSGAAAESARAMDMLFRNISKDIANLESEIETITKTDHVIKLRAWWSGFNDSATDRAAASTARPPAGPVTAPTASKTADFAQIVSSRVAFGSPGSKSKTPVIADPREITLLGQILAALHYMPARAA